MALHLAGKPSALLMLLPAHALHGLHCGCEKSATDV